MGWSFDVVEVVPLSSGWALAHEEPSAISATFETKVAAISAGIRAILGRGCVVVMTSDGRVQTVLPLSNCSSNEALGCGYQKNLVLRGGGSRSTETRWFRDVPKRAIGSRVED